MSDYELPETPELENSLRAAMAALLQIPGVKAELPSIGAMSASELMQDFRFVADAVETAAATHLGPLVSWTSPHAMPWELSVTGIDFGNCGQEFGVALGADATEGPNGDWTDSALSVAAAAYRRECGWDFAPGEAGMWLLALAPVSGAGSSEDEPWSYTGHLTGFVILHDRDSYGKYESVAHIWTASAWRRRGIASRLLSEAQRRVRSDLVFEEPYTDAGGALIAAAEHPTR